MDCARKAKGICHNRTAVRYFLGSFCGPCAADGPMEFEHSDARSGLLIIFHQKCGRVLQM